MLRKITLACIILLLSSITLLGAAQSLGATHAQGATAINSISVERSPESSVAYGLIDRIKISWPWYLTRACGFVAAGSMIILMISGVGLETGHAFSFLEPLTAWASHRALGIAFMISTILHVGSLYLDHFIPFTLFSLLVPFVSSYKTVTILGVSVGSLWVALGVIALYLSAAIVITSLLWIEKMPKLWKLTHLMSYLAILFVFVHGLYLGTDLAHGILRWLWVAAALVVVYLSFIRLWRVKTL